MRGCISIVEVVRFISCGGITIKALLHTCFQISEALEEMPPKSSMFNQKSHFSALLAYLSGQVSPPPGWSSLKYPKENHKVLPAIKYKNAEK